MSTFNYFAYGSNLLKERLQARCPSAEFMGIALAHGYSLDFSKTGRDGSGKATIFQENGNSIYGALFTVALSELNNLDEAEGSGYDYERIDTFKVVSHADDREIECITYQAFTHRRALSLRPYDWYHQLVVSGLKQHNFPEDYLEEMRSIESLVDFDNERKSKIEALFALEKSGYLYK